MGMGFKEFFGFSGRSLPAARTLRGSGRGASRSKSVCARQYQPHAGGRLCSVTPAPIVEVTGARLWTVDQRAMLPAHPGKPPCQKALLAACGVQRNADKDNCDREHDDANENVHGYSFPI